MKKIKLFLIYLFKRAFLYNIWLWFHILAAPVLYWIILQIVPYLNLAYAIFFIITILWEVLEYATSGRDRIIETYGEVSDFVLDALGDIIGANLAVVIVLVLFM